MAVGTGGRSSGRVTVHDVAALAGVTQSTVSKALNNTGQLREETRRRVREAAETLGFISDGVGRSLSTGRTYTVALLTGDSIGRFSIPILLGAENALSVGQIMVLLCDSQDDPLREQRYVSNLVSRRVEGLIVTGRRTEPRPRLDVPLPTVYAFAPSMDAADSSVVTDDAIGARQIHSHLLSLGRRRIAHITGPVEHLSARIRAEALLECAREAGIPLVHEPLFGEWSEAWGRAAADVVLGEHPGEVDAISCGSDQIARGVTERLRERGLRIPMDVAVTGFDNWDVMVDASRPPLTTIDLQLEQIGRRSAQLLLDVIAGKPHSGVEKIAPTLVTRASTLGD